jgi:PKD repeat protein
MRRTALPLAATLAALSALPSLGAQSTLIIPSDVTATTDGAGSTAYPWDRDTATQASNDIRVQYSYDSSNIPVAFPILIRQLRFRANATTSTWTGGDYSNCEVRIGASATDYATASTTFDTNWGGTSPAPNYSGPVTVQPGTGNGTGVPGPWYVTITLPTPVLYDPTSGADLLIDLMHDGLWTGVATSGSTATDTGRNACSRMYNLTDWQGTTGSLQQSVGLVCELTYTPASGLYPGFTGTPTTGTSPLQVQFTDGSFSSDPNGITSWAWDFDNDGNVDSTAQNPLHTYVAGGTYSVRLTVTDQLHGSQSLLQSDYIVVDPVDADFTATPAFGSAPLQVQFTDTSTGGPIAWNWDFDSNGTIDSTAQNPLHVYTAGGTYSVTLSVTNGANQDTEIKTDLIRVLGATNNTQSPEILEYQFNEPRGTSAANTAATTAAPAHATVTVANWQGDPGRTFWQGNDPGYGAVAANNASPYTAIDTGWLVDITGSHTISFWTRPQATIGTCYAFGMVGGGSGRLYYTSSLTGYSLRSWGPVPITDAGTSPNAVTGWNHWAIVIDDAAGTAQWYLNGVADGTQTTFTPGTFAYTPGGSLALGTYSTLTSSSNYLRYADLDDFRIYSRALTPAQILQSMLFESPVTSTFGDGCAGPTGVPQISTSGGAPSIAGNASFAIEASGMEPGVPAAINLGLAQTSNPFLPYDLSIIGASYAGCFAEVFPDLVALGIVNTTGSATAALAIPADPSLANFHFYGQVVVLGTLGAVSPALDINFK